MAEIVILGGPSTGLLVAEAAEAAGHQVVGFLNDVEQTVGGYPVLGRFDRWKELSQQLIAAFPLPGASRERYRRLRDLTIPEARFCTIVHPTAVVSPRAELGAGCFVAPHAVVEHGARIGAHSIVRAGAYVSHDVTTGAFAHIGPHATLLGRSRLGEGVHVGANSVVKDSVTVGDYALLGVGAVVVKDVTDGQVVAGNPARVLR